MSQCLNSESVPYHLPILTIFFFFFSQTSFPTYSSTKIDYFYRKQDMKLKRRHKDHYLDRAVLTNHKKNHCVRFVPIYLRFSFKKIYFEDYFTFNEFEYCRVHFGIMVLHYQMFDVKRSDSG